MLISPSLPISPRVCRSGPWPATAIFAAAVALICGVASAQPLELPAETWLDPLAVVVELDGATVEVVREPTTSPRLRARLRSDAGESAILDLVRGTEAVEVRRGDADTRPVVVELVLGLGQPLRIAGIGLEITIDGGGAELWAGEAVAEDGDEGETAGSPDGGTPDGSVADGGTGDPKAPLVELTVEGSTVTLTGVSGAVVKAVDGSLFTAATGGVLNLQLHGGDAEISDHHGNVGLRGVGAEVWMAEPVGALDIGIEAGSLALRGGRGSANFTASGGRVEVDGWSGQLSFRGNDATFDFRATEATRSSLSLDGARLDASVSGLAGMLSAQLRGGSLRVVEKRGNTRIVATEGAEISIDRASGSYTLSLNQSSARLADVRGPQIKVDLRDGRLDGERIRHLELVAERGEVYVGGLEELAKAEVVDTRMELDLTHLQRPPSLSLQGGSEAFLRLATPCAVELTDAQLLSDRIRITGCEFYAASNRRAHANARFRRGVDGNRRLTLRAQVTEESHLEVEGHP